MTTVTATELRTKRLAAGITADLLARHAHIDRAALGRIERGLVHPSPKRLQRIAEALEALIRAKTEIRKTAAAHGCPELVA